MKNEKTICLCHDTEKGWGHTDVDPDYAEFANRTAPKYLEEMLVIEKEMNVKVTYNVVACLMNEIRERIESEGHCIAFHSFDHDMNTEQLDRCRQIDDRIRGYRTTRSVITPELSDENLRHHHIEWLGSSVKSFGFRTPRMENGIVKIPILFDDFEMYKEKTRYADWEQKAIEKIKENDFVAFGLHDCYAHYWLPHYRKFLKKIKGMGKFKTFNEVANEVIVSSPE